MKDKKHLLIIKKCLIMAIISFIILDLSDPFL